MLPQNPNSAKMETQINNSVFRTVTFKMHGMNQSSSMLHHLCTETYSDVIFIQEHWLTPDKLNQIFGFSDNYIGFGISAMEDKVASGIFYGRPHGGVAVLVNNKYSKLIHNVICRERYVIIMIESVAFVNVYFPCKSGIDIRGRNTCRYNYTYQLLQNRYNYTNQ